MNRGGGYDRYCGQQSILRSVTLEQRPTGNIRSIHSPSGRSSRQKGQSVNCPKAVVCLTCSRNGKEASEEENGDR